MIAKDYVTEWRSQAPWVIDAHVEQDLVISRALVEIFGVPEVSRRLAFRGGTALHKLHLAPAARYSEDIDLVQVSPEPIGATLDAVRSVLDRWLGQPRRELKEGRANLVYRFPDIAKLLRPGFDWEIRDAAAFVAEQLLARLPE